MKGLSDRCAGPGDALSEVTVVDDQLGRFAFTEDMAEAIFHLIGYCEGDLANDNDVCIYPVIAVEYCATEQGPIAPHPEHFTLDLSRLKAAGFAMLDWEQLLSPYIKPRLDA